MGASAKATGRAKESQPIEAALRIGDSFAAAKGAQAIATSQTARTPIEERLVGVLDLQRFVDRRPRQLQSAGDFRY